MMPPRWATASPHWVASLSRGRIPVEDDEIDLQLATVGEVHGFARLGALLNNLFGVLLV